MYKKVSILLAVFVLFFSSCDEWLDLSPENDVIEEEFWESEQDVYSYVLGCYAGLLDEDLIERVYLWGELRGDMLSYNSGISYNYLYVMNGTIVADNSLFDWESIYAVINNCNILLEKASKALDTDDTFTEEELAAYEAEGLAVRGLLYFYLVRAYGDVPLMLEGITSDDEDFFVAKSDQDVIINQIINDLTTAAENALETYGTTEHDKGRFTKYGIQALLADVYLWNEDYENCVDACDEIINSSEYYLVAADDWFTDLFVSGNSDESIFELQFSSEKTNPFFNFFHPTDGDKQFLTSYVATYLYEDEDIRGDSATFWDPDQQIIYKYIGQSAEEQYMCDEDGSYANFIIYRYADVLLMKAEALNQLEKGEEAMELVNKIQKRARAEEEYMDVDDYDGITEMILLERQKEFAYEGKRWFDVLRNVKRNDFESVEIYEDMVYEYASASIADMLTTRAANPLSFYFPIYQDELDVNPNLEQNSYYE